MLEQPYQIALWGPPRVGKTALLVYLVDAAAKTDWDVQPATEESRVFVETMRRRLLNNQFPEATAVGHRDEVVYRLTRGARQALLKVEDLAGGKWLALDKDELAVLTGAQALILIVDPNKPPLQIEFQVQSMLDKLSLDRSHTIDMRPVAICVTKIDGRIESVADLDEAIHNPDAFVRRRMRDSIRDVLRTTLQRRCPNHRFFPVSAVGVRVQSGVVRHAVMVDERLGLRPTSGGTPVNLTAPFDWIFDQLAQNA
jgi:hypothetical protein